MSIGIETLKKIRLFESLEDMDLLELSRRGATQTVISNQTIYRVGDKVCSIFVILSGRVRLFVPGKYGNPVSLALLREGDIFGDLPSSTEDVCSASAVALTDVHLLVLNNDKVAYLIARCPDVALKIIGAFEHRLQGTYQLLTASRLGMKIRPR